MGASGAVAPEVSTSPIPASCSMSGSPVGSPTSTPPRMTVSSRRSICVLNTAGSKPEETKPIPARTMPAATSPPATAR